eukprot:g11258.t1
MRIRDALSRHGPPEVDEDPWKSAPQAEGINQWQIDGLSQWIEEIKLEAHAVQIEAWAKEMGATTELLEHWEALAAALPLRPLEARRLQREGLKWLERPQFIESTERTHATRLPPHVIQATHAVHGYAGSPYALNAEHLGGKLPTDSTASAGSRTSTSDSSLRLGTAVRNGKALVSPCSTADLDALEELEELEASVEAVSKEVEEWRPSSFEFQRTLQMAGRNQGAVNLMKCLETGKFVAVKAMPQSWTTLGHQEHRRAHPRDTENPWMDLGLVRYLSKTHGCI